MSESGEAEQSGSFQSSSLSPLAILNRFLACAQPTKPAFAGAARGGRRPGIRNATPDCNSLYQQITDKIIAELEQSRLGPAVGQCQSAA